MNEEISVFYSQGKYWAYTKSELEKIGSLPPNMSFVFSIRQNDEESVTEKESLSELRLRVQVEAHVRSITHIVNL